MAESVDAADLKSVSCKGVGVQVPPPAPYNKIPYANKTKALSRDYKNKNGLRNLNMFEDLEDDIFDLEEEYAANGLPLPRHNADWFGNEEIEQKLLNLMMSGKAPHAMIFSGLEGIGKSTMAFRLARFLLSGKAESASEEEGAGLFGEELPPPPAPENLYIAPDNPAFKRVASGGHSDLLVIEKQYDDKKNRVKDSVAVEDVRKVTPFLRLTASHEGGWRVVIVDDADTMTRSAQNAILKILEEPPERTLLILIAHRPGALLPTIHSRSRIIPFLPLSREQFGTLIQKEAPSLTAQEIDTLFAVSGGSIGQALRLQEDGGLESVNNVLELMQNWPDWDWVAIHKLADKIGMAGQDDALRAYREIFLWTCEQILRAKAKNEALSVPLDLPAFEHMKRHYTLEEWIRICENLKEHFDMVQFANLDKRQIVLGSFMVFNNIDKHKAAA